ncbi:MAG: GlsB/YeaQ/YmgE family stress response membrane protein [Chloroflexota bacterium]|nr:GlsB/YeaQ/YmgE family stress response membrane protein [Chloroflexota bacterium]
MSIIAWLVVGAIAGFIASKVVPGDEGYGVLGGLIAGIVGAMVGGFLFGLLSGNDDWLTGINIGTIIAAIVGAIIVVFVWNMITKRSGNRAV